MARPIPVNHSAQGRLLAKQMPFHLSCIPRALCVRARGLATWASGPAPHRGPDPEEKVATKTATFPMLDDVRIQVGNPILLASIQRVLAGQTAARSHDFRVGGCV